MARVKSNVAHHARKKKIMQAAKGARGARSKLYKPAKETVERGMQYAYRDRRKKKGEFRRLWITRINAAARMHGFNYSGRDQPEGAGRSCRQGHGRLRQDHRGGESRELARQVSGVRGQGSEHWPRPLIRFTHPSRR